jgi:hypothetical protein
MNSLLLPRLHLYCLFLAVAALLPGCAKRSEDAAANAAPAKHQHHPPHGGTAVVLGDEQFHLELVRDADAGTLSAYVLDDEMEEFVRIAAPAITLEAQVKGGIRRLVLSPVASSATGETVGNTAFFQGSADWLKTGGKFDATLEPLSIHGTSFPALKFNFPAGNDTD